MLSFYLSVILTLLITLCGLTSQKTHWGGLWLGGLVHEEAHPCFPYIIQTPLKCIDAGSINAFNAPKRPSPFFLCIHTPQKTLYQ